MSPSLTSLITAPAAQLAFCLRAVAVGRPR